MKLLDIKINGLILEMKVAPLIEKILTKYTTDFYTSAQWTTLKGNGMEIRKLQGYVYGMVEYFNNAGDRVIMGYELNPSLLRIKGISTTGIKIHIGTTGTTPLDSIENVSIEWIENAIYNILRMADRKVSDIKKVEA